MDCQGPTGSSIRPAVGCCVSQLVFSRRVGSISESLSCSAAKFSPAKGLPAGLSTSSCGVTAVIRSSQRSVSSNASSQIGILDNDYKFWRKRSLTESELFILSTTHKSHQDRASRNDWLYLTHLWLSGLHDMALDGVLAGGYGVPYAHSALLGYSE